MNGVARRSAAPESALKVLLRLLYGWYAILVFLTVGTITLLGVTLVPGLGLASRRIIAHRGAKLFFKLAGLPVTVRGLEHLPSGPCVLVANHASYLDGVLLKAVLPARFSFVIKKEIVNVPLAATLLRRIGSEFVDRFNRHAGAVDARRLMRAASIGQALVFFPEGTFRPEPGVAHFHSGAFVTAARAQIPVVPTVIRGTRAVLPCDRLLPRRHPIEVDVLAPIDWSDPSRTAERVRDLARERIVAHVDEPDLVAAANASVVSHNRPPAS